MDNWAERAFERLKDKEGDNHLRIQHDVMVQHQTLEHLNGGMT
jgi:hypothetical protein